MAGFYGPITDKVASEKDALLWLEVTVKVGQAAFVLKW